MPGANILQGTPIISSSYSTSDSSAVAIGDNFNQVAGKLTAQITNTNTSISALVPSILSATNVGGSAVSLTSATWTEIVSLTLTAGKWRIDACGLFNNSGVVTGILSQIAVTTTSGSGTGVIQGTNSVLLPLVGTSDANVVLVNIPIFVTVTTTATYYVNLYTEYTGSNMVGEATIYAQRLTTATS
jgi:hypothetical protein